VEADNRNELLEMIDRSYKLRGSIDSVIDGVISIAQKAAPGSNNDFTRTGVFIFITLLLLTDGRESDAAMSESDGKVLWGISSP
jgi:hypothetical protein